MSEQIIDSLLASPEPSLRWKVRTRVLGEPDNSPRIRRLRGEIKRSPRVAALLARQARDGTVPVPHDAYRKWQGAHWVVATLAELGYPAGDKLIAPLVAQACDAQLRPGVFRDRVVAGRHRRCASTLAYPLLAAIRLGFADAEDRGSRLASLLLRWQWPEGGWNCDPSPTATSPSFMETLLPMRALSAYGETADAVTAAAEVFLSRRLFKRRSTGEVIRPDMARLHHPLYWHYDLLGGLVGLAEVGKLKDPRCGDALDLLQDKRLPDGGWPAEGRYYRTVGYNVAPSGSYVDWGVISPRQSNPWVTADALWVLTAAGRLKV
jgi:hypothetical protein